MGTWGSGLFCNDLCLDIKDTYMEKIKKCSNNKQVLMETLKEYDEIIDTDEEPLLWYSLADTMWNIGRLNDEVKSKAFYWIRKEGGTELWEDDKKGLLKWKETIRKLEEKLNQDMSEEKKFRIPKEFKTNPWNLNDIYAYQLHLKESEDEGMFGKYVCLQKVGEYVGDGKKYDILQLYDKVYDAIPSLDDLRNIRILPMEFCPEYYDIGNPKEDCISGVCVVKQFIILKSREYPKKYVSLVGNIKNMYGYLYDIEKCYASDATFWCGFERNFISYYSSWKNYEYDFVNGEIVVKRRISN